MGSWAYDQIHNRFSIPLVLSVFFWIPERRVLGPNTKHVRFFMVADLVYAAGDSARNKEKKASPKGAMDLSTVFR